MSVKFKIGNTIVGENHPPYYIADIGANHDGQIERALRLIELAKEAGAHAAKFQNFSASKIVSKRGFDKLGSQLSHQSAWKKSVYEIYEDASIDRNWTQVLKEKCDKIGIEYFTSAYDFESVDLVDDFVNVYKIGSGDITWIDIINYTASKGKPILIASGASEMKDVERAVNILRRFDVPVCLMQCNTNYTLDVDKYKYVNLNVLKTYKQKFPDILLGLSDHTFGHATVVGAIALGARIIEKHFTDDNDREGPDHKFAMNPKAWKEMVKNGNEVYYALGDGVKRVEENEKDAIVVQQRSLLATRDLSAGHTLSIGDMEALRPRPEGSLPPYMAENIIGKRLVKAINAGEHFTNSHIS